MSKLPIEIIRISNQKGLYSDRETIRFHLVIKEKSQSWDRSHLCNLADLVKLRNDLNVIIDSIGWYENLGISESLALRISNTVTSDNICLECKHQKTAKCIPCITILQSPLERKLYSKLIDAPLYFEIQQAINVFGKKAGLKGENEKDLRLKYHDLLTQVDFLLPHAKYPICVYTDGHTYHERTEEQAKRDRSIDRKLQELGFTVMRFTGKEINESLNMVVNQIIKMRENKS